jgi:hypothetical protein
MQYLYSQEEHDRVKTDKEEFERRVKAEITKRLDDASSRVATVLTEFVNTFSGGARGQFDYFGSNICVDTLRKLAKQIGAANRGEDFRGKESCDRDTGTVVK